MDALPGVPGVSKNQNFFLQIKMLRFCARIAQKGTNFEKLSKLKKKIKRVFQGGELLQKFISANLHYCKKIQCYSEYTKFTCIKKVTKHLFYKYLSKKELFLTKQQLNPVLILKIILQPFSLSVYTRYSAKGSVKLFKANFILCVDMHYRPLIMSQKGTTR